MVLLSLIVCASCSTSLKGVEAPVVTPIEKIDLGEYGSIENAEVAQGKLWLRTDSFRLWALDLTTGKPERVVAPRAWLFLQKIESGRLLALSQERRKPGWFGEPQVILWELRGGQWVPLLSIPAPETSSVSGELPILGVFERGEELGLVSSAGVQFVGNNGQLSEEIRFPRPLLHGNDPAAPLVRAGFLFVGEPTRSPEDGPPQRRYKGGMFRIDIRSWEIERIDLDSPHRLLPDSSCPRCLLAVTGFDDIVQPDGGVARICGKSVHWVFREHHSPEYAPPPQSTQDAVQERPEEREGFHTVSKACSTPEGLIVDLYNDLRRVREGRSERLAWPQMRGIAGLMLSREIPGTLVVSTDHWPHPKPHLVCLDRGR